MQDINLDRGLALLEARLHGRQCLPELLALAQEYPQSLNRIIAIADAIETDLAHQGEFSKS